MASPFNMPQWPGVNEPLSFPVPAPKPEHHQNSVEPELVLSRLREQAAGGKQELDILLGAIAVAAQALTDATGAALGLRRNGTVVCVGRSGETSPALGARLSEESGISGECLRSCRSQRCDDTETDARVDSEVCRDLGLRSIAAVPVRSRLETVGILEVFSTEPQAFTDEHLMHLSSLAEIADAASAAQSAKVQPDELAAHNGATPARPDLPILESQWVQKERHPKPIWRYIGVGGAVVVLALFSVAIWRMWHEIRNRDEQQPVAVQSPPPAATPATQNQVDQPGLQAKPAPEEISSAGTNHESTHRDRVVQAASIDPEPDDGLIRTIPVDTASTPDATRPQNDAANAAPSAPPQVAMVSTPDASLDGILAGQQRLPRLSPSVSEGVSPLVLEHKVMPAYPHDARMLRLEGAVVMHATVTDKGRVSDLKVVSGNPVLARAALDAVRQWRYRPAELNGKPTNIGTDITISFKLP